MSLKADAFFSDGPLGGGFHYTASVLFDRFSMEKRMLTKLLFHWNMNMNKSWMLFSKKLNYFIGGWGVDGFLLSLFQLIWMLLYVSLFFVVVVVIVVAFFVLMIMHIDILLSFCMQCTGHSAICRTCYHVKHAICQNVRPHTR